ncbi:MAG: asparagine synthase (glutamine-hydrolyzing) [Geobacteraceae bacterium GWC2_58_44]|nr:MAG: asparagine synthase (glutamine-hydrolyzing) [Geobacteraceae bacterium GWC2_58_44]HBG06023.1 asparagine synthase (glutamine-hydrolyzing) [Geobacter sp.]
MCGIAGIIAPQAARYGAALERMSDALVHRGPDGSGRHFFENCALGHRRLSIVDLVTGRQPMLSPTGTTGITFNGEIYGYQAIRQTLADYPFSTASDTEVILALYHGYHHDCLAHLPGMFAFAIWDDARQELFCARDRFGEKPFFYAFGAAGEFIFASEIKAILASGLVTPTLSSSSLIHYLRHLYVHPHETIYGNIYTLPPAHSLCLKGGKATVRRYWQVPGVTEGIEPGRAVEQFRFLMEQAVARQLVADVPVGFLLSGGLDSSTLVAVAARQRDNLRTFSFGFEDAVSDLRYAGEIAERYRTGHLELTARDVDIAEMIETMQAVYDEPFADSSNIPTYLISKLSREHVKVALSGDGADELLGGYCWWYHPVRCMAEARNSSYFECALIRLKGWLLAKSQRQLAAQQLYEREGERYSRCYGSVMEAHYGQNIFFTGAELSALGIAGAKGLDTRNFDRYSWRPSEGVNDALLMDVENYLPGDILAKTDRASMANSLELRSPFLDADFASFCLSLPSALKITRERDKAILRDAYADAWTDSIRRRGKYGFAAPVDKWLARGSVQALKQSYLNDPRRKIFSLLSFEKSRGFVERNDYRTWILLVLAAWLEKHDFQMPEGS